MNRKDFDNLVAESRARQDKLRDTKGQEYIKHDPDQLDNFKRIAKSLGVHPVTVWAVYAHKHWDSILSYLKTRVEGSESIVGRLDDLGNYLHLLEGLLEDEGVLFDEKSPPGSMIPISKGELCNSEYAHWVT